MKYMTFNSSCSYAGLANLLDLYGHRTEDADIARAISLPRMLDVQDGCYLAGAMLQSADWFNLYLLPRGFRMTETAVSRADVPSWLAEHAPAMLGLRVSEQAKHAAVCTAVTEGRYHLINNKWAASDEPDTLALTADELLSRLDESVLLATVAPCAPTTVDITAPLRRSAQVLAQYRVELLDLCRQTLPHADILRRMNTHFRALLVDKIAMMQLIGENALASDLTQVQRAFLTTLRTPADAIRLADVLPMELLTRALDALAALTEDA